MPWERVRDYRDEVRDLTDRGTLINARDLIGGLFLVPALSTTEAQELVLGQASIARRRGNQRWIRQAASDCQSILPYAWIDQHLCVLGARRKQRTAPAAPVPGTQASQDYRALMDPGLERRSEVVQGGGVTTAVPIPATVTSTDDTLGVPQYLTTAPTPVPAPPGTKYQRREPSPTASVAPSTVTGSPRRAWLPKKQKRRHRNRKRHSAGATDQQSTTGPPRDLSFSESVRSSATVRPPAPTEKSTRSTMRTWSPVRAPERSPRPSKPARPTTTTRPYKRAASPLDPFRNMVMVPPPPHVMTNDPASLATHQPPVCAPTRLESTAVVGLEPLTETRKTKRKIRYPCAIRGCQVVTSFLKRHLLNDHLAGIFQEHMEPTPDICQQRHAAITMQARAILGTRGTLAQLMKLIDSCGLIFPGWAVTDPQHVAMREQCRVLGWDLPQVFTLVPLNSPATLIHWRAQLAISQSLATDAISTLRESFPEPDLSPEMPIREHLMVQDEEEVIPKATDAHFHLDRTRRTLKLARDAGLEEIGAAIGPLAEGYEVRLQGCVAVFCDPQSYPTAQEIQDLRQQGLKIAVGVHPKTPTLTPTQMENFRQCFLQDGVCALGEVGLDHSVDPELWATQETQLAYLLRFLGDSSRTLVIHCRGMRSDPLASEAYHRCLSIITALVGRTQKVHLHCFGGSAEVVDGWLLHLPECYFGVTTMVRNFNQRQIAGLQRIPRDRLVLESDAPYFTTQPYRCGAPHLLGYVAEEVGGILNITREEILQLTLDNAARLYGE